MEPINSGEPVCTASAEDALCEQFIGLFMAMGAAMHTLAEENGLTKIQLYNLYAIEDQGEDVAMSKLAQLMHCDASNITGIVDRLVVGEFLTRVESLRDRRAKLLKLTPKGKALIVRVKQALPERLGCDTLTAKQKQCLSSCLRIMCASRK